MNRLLSLTVVVGSKLKKQYNSWIVGASSGIGAALARALAAEGGDLFLSARNAEALRSVKDTIELSYTQEVQCHPLDVVDPEAVDSIAKRVCTRSGFQRIVYLAALYDPMPLRQLNLSSASQTIDVNIKGLLNVLASVIPILREQGGGQVVICGSPAGYRGLPNAQPYAATKSAVMNIAETLRLEEEGIIDVKLISPGFVETRLTKKNDFQMPFLISAETAAKSIVKGLKSNRFEIHFPKRFTMLLKFLKVLPYPLYFRIAGLIDRSVD